LDCPACACPNRPGAVKCIYCGTLLPAQSGQPKAPYFENLMEFFNNSTAKKRSPVLKIAINAFLSAMFFALGTFFVFKAFKHGGYFNWAALSLFYFYGASLLKNAYLLLYNKKLD